uniref:Transcription factor IIIA n=1 Tax=Mastacembelus armatus TaxID=205130 RepID=A0A3Q3LSB8_9TELE
MGERCLTGDYTCPVGDCRATFTKAWRLQAHVCRHIQLKPFSCEDCDKSYHTRFQLTRHKLSHSGEKRYRCQDDDCSKAFPTIGSMKNHMARVHHHQGKKYECRHQDCGKRFNKRNQLKAHEPEHQELLPFCCTFSGCTKEFSSHGRLKHHKKVHEGYTCQAQGCSFCGKTWTEYLKHRKEHKVKLSCSVCKKQFSNTWFFRQHELRVHSGEKRMLSCPREGCEKKFTRHFHLESHILGDHEGKKPFICGHAGCGRSFAMKESLWRHGVVHDPAKKKLKVTCISCLTGIHLS